MMAGTLLIFFAASHLPAQSPQAVYEGDEITADREFDFRDWVSPANEIEELSEEAVKIETTVRPEEGSPERRIRTTTDFHAVFPLSLETLVPLFTDFEKEHELYGRLTHTEDLSPGASPMEPHFQEVKTRFKFLGIGTVQHYILYKVPQRISDGEFLIKWTLAESLNRNLYHYTGSWYLKRLPPADDGTPRTYIRNYAVIGHLDPPRGIKLAFRLFLDGEIHSFFEEIYRAAER
jgi:hypothetical protein